MLKFNYYFCFFIALTLISCVPGKNKIIIGENFLSKTLFYEAPMTNITSIVIGNIDSHPDSDIGIFDQFGLYVINPESGALKSEIKFNITTGVIEPKIIYTDKDGHFEIMDKSDGRLIDQTGNIIWTYKNPVIYSMDAGVRNHDSAVEFFVATGIGLHGLKHDGEELWQKNSGVYDVAVHNPDNGEKPFVITTKDGGHLQFRDFDGNILRDVKPQVKMHDIELINWPNAWNILTRSDSNIIILNFEGKVIFEHKLKNFFKDYNIFEIRGITVKFYENQNPYLAIVTRFRSSSGKSMLSVFDPEGKLVYKELLNVTTGLTAKRSTSSKNEDLLVGDGPGKVYIYRLRH